MGGSMRYALMLLMLGCATADEDFRYIKGKWRR